MHGPQPKEPHRIRVVSVLGAGQILAWGSSYYLVAVLAKPIGETMGWPPGWIVGGLSLGLLTSGLISPRVGRTIERWGGRPVLAFSALLLAIGLVGLSLSTHIAFYVGAWLVVGLGMGAGLYDAAFATLGRIYGETARSAIAALTLWGGFASTVCWPLSAFLANHFGWRGACLVYAALLFFLVMPSYLFLLPREAERPNRPVAKASAIAGDTPPGARASGADAAVLFVLLALSLTLSYTISSVISVHLLTILEGSGIAFSAAVALGAIVGPAQVGARLIEMLIGRYHHPIWTMIASALFMSTGLAILALGLPLLALGLVIYGAGIGIESIARGTVPLALFGAEGYAGLMGRLAMPSLIAQSISPTIGAFLLQQEGADVLLAALTALAVFKVALVVSLWWRHRSSANARPAA
ncbi:MAG: MFS transporter [Proteobacteria bacterium]|nr:MFS transporter [Pseudomonadota bacterium]MBI3499198.1 MFS transporter [Pseudomonadota bacterium]